RVDLPGYLSQETCRMLSIKARRKGLRRESPAASIQASGERRGCPKKQMERKTGFEPTIPSLAISRTSSRLLPVYGARLSSTSCEQLGGHEAAHLGGRLSLLLG